MHKPTMRTVSRWMVISLVAIVGGSIALHSVLYGSAGAATAPHLAAGKSLDGQLAPDFTLRDQAGQAIRLSHLRGHVVVVTFLDATCVSACAVSAQCLDQTGQLLASASSQVEWLAVSVNPRNTPADAKAFIEQHHVTVPLHVLLGSAEQLRAVWQAYGVQVDAAAPDAGSGAGGVGPVATYVLDADGHEREALAQSYDPQVAAQDIRALIGR